MLAMPCLRVALDSLTDTERDAAFGDKVLKLKMKE